MNPRPYILDGTITSCGFASGHRIVVGHWQRGPLGPMVDIMWVDPQNVRRLIAPDTTVADFVGSIYVFDEVIIDAHLRASVEHNVMRVVSERVAFAARFGRGIPIPFRRFRRPFITRLIEQPIAHAYLGVNTYGTTSRGIREWYQADRLQLVTDATARINGEEAGTWGAVWPPIGVGFGEPPKRPSRVAVRPRLLDPTGALDDMIQSARSTIS